jgi:hypothetical protein
MFRGWVTEIARDKQLNYVNFKFFVALASHVWLSAEVRLNMSNLEEWHKFAGVTA